MKNLYKFEAGVLAYQNGLLDAAEALWKQVDTWPATASAAYNLAVLIDNSTRRTIRQQEVIFWYERAASLGLAQAQFNYGGLYYTGEMVAHDLDTAIYWWQLAAQQQHEAARFNLALLHYLGLGEVGELGDAAFLDNFKPQVSVHSFYRTS